MSLIDERATTEGGTGGAGAPTPAPAANGRQFLVVHPLDDEPEEKYDASSLPPMTLRGSAKIALLALRVYLIAMMGLVLYRILQVVGVLGG